MATKKKGGGAATPAGPSKLLAASAKLKKVLKESDPTITVDPSMARQSRPHIDSGSIILNFLIGGRPNRFGVPPCPGWPRGAFSNIYGHESSGKTTIALEAALRVIQAGGVVSFIDWENAVDLSYAEALGIPVGDPTVFALQQPATLEEGLKVLITMAMHGVDLIVLDSISAGVPEDVFKQSLDEQGGLGRVGLQAAKWSAFLPKVAHIIARTGSHVMGISQLRKKIDTFSKGAGPTTQASGGEAWKFYSAVRMRFQRVSTEKGKVLNPLTMKVEEQPITSKIRAKVEKSKVSQSQQNQLDFYLRYGEGIDDLRACIDVAQAHGLIKKSGNWYDWERPSGKIRSNGVSAFRKDVLAADGAAEELLTVARQQVVNVMSKGHQIIEEDEDDNIDMLNLMDQAKDLDLDEIVDDDAGDASDD